MLVPSEPIQEPPCAALAVARGFVDGDDPEVGVIALRVVSQLVYTLKQQDLLERAALRVSNVAYPHNLTIDVAPPYRVVSLL